jgi:hypothetical protein
VSHISVQEDTQGKNEEEEEENIGERSSHIREGTVPKGTNDEKGARERKKAKTRKKEENHS